MHYLDITPVHKFDDFYVKREDLAWWSNKDFPSGSKVRQYLSMANGNSKGIPCLVGCSADSAMQIYVAATAKQLGTKGIIYTAKRKIKSHATLYAEMLGAEIIEVKPGYLSNIRKRARQAAINLKDIVMWDRSKAIQDTIDQCVNIPEGVERIIVPTGSGLTAAGVLVGVAKHCTFPGPEVVAVCTSPMADRDVIWRLVSGVFKSQDLQAPVQAVTVIPPMTAYGIPMVAQLPDGTPLDPFYAAKAWGYMCNGDMLWPPGLRPVIAMPEICQKEFKDWKGPKPNGSAIP